MEHSEQNLLPFIPDQTFEKEKLRNELDILKAVKCMIVHKLSANDERLVVIIISLGKLTSYHEMEKVYWYVLDVERITLLMMSLARRLARSELRIKMTGFVDCVEMRNKIDKIEDQLKDANSIDKKLHEKCRLISQKIDKYLGIQTKKDFLQLIDSKTKLLISSKEIDEKIRLFKDISNIRVLINIKIFL